MTDDRINTLERKVAHLDSAVTRLIAKMETHLEEKREMEKTLRNIDDNIKALTIQMATASGERHKETETLLHPLWEVVRKHDSRFHECGESVKKETRADLKTLVAILVVFLSAVISVGGYAYHRDRQEIKDDVNHIIRHIDNHHTAKGNK